MSSVSPVVGEVVLSGEQEDLDSVREQALLSPSATAFTDPEQTHPFLIFLESLVTLISTHFLVDKQQVNLATIHDSSQKDRIKMVLENNGLLRNFDRFSRVFFFKFPRILLICNLEKVVENFLYPPAQLDIIFAVVDIQHTQFPVD